MNLEERVEQLEFQVEQLEFQNELLFHNSNIDRYIFETKLTREEYHSIMDLMDQYRKKIESGEKVSHATFEEGIYQRVPKKNGDYHFCELIAKLFAEDGRWEEVFPALYGDMPKYGGPIG